MFLLDDSLICLMVYTDEKNNHFIMNDNIKNLNKNDNYINHFLNKCNPVFVHNNIFKKKAYLKIYDNIIIIKKPNEPIYMLIFGSDYNKNLMNMILYEFVHTKNDDYDEIFDIYRNNEYDLLTKRFIEIYNDDYYRFIFKNI